MEMLDDKDESLAWRDYCLQFLAQCLPFSEEPGIIEEKIRKYSQSSLPIAGTALLLLSHLAEQGHVVITEADISPLLSKLEQPEVPETTKTSILAVVGRRRDGAAMPAVRRLATQDENPAVKRVAIATMGLLVDSSMFEYYRARAPEFDFTRQDLAIIKKATRHPNMGVRLAAQGALSRIQSNPFAPAGSSSQ